MRSPPRGTTGVQFQTPLRCNPETYMRSGNPTLSGRESMDSEPLGNQDSNPIARGVTIPSTRMNDEIKMLRKLLNELCDKVYGSGGSGYVFEGKPVRSQLDMEALLEKELPSNYVLSQ